MPSRSGGAAVLLRTRPELPVVAAGSLLDFALREFSHSMPVGRIEFLHLHPMSFEEFLKAGKTGTLKSLLQFLGEKRRQRAVRFYLGRPSLEEVALPGDEPAKGQLLSLPLYLAGQLDRFLAEAFGPAEAED